MSGIKCLLHELSITYMTEKLINMYVLICTSAITRPIELSAI